MVSAWQRGGRASIASLAVSAPFTGKEHRWTRTRY